MEGIINLLEGFENLAYRILMLVIIIPKTLLKIIFQPVWVPGYIKGQLDIIEKNKTVDEKSKSPSFVEYLSPVVLLLVLALVPALLLNYLPETGVKVAPYTGKDSALEGSPGSLVFKNLSASNDVFTATAKFSSSARGKENRFEWRMTKLDPQTGEYVNVPDSETTHKDSDLVDSRIVYPDDLTVQDTYSYKFKEPGKYNVYVTVTNYSGLVYSGSMSFHVSPTDTKELKAIPDSIINAGSAKEEVRQSLDIDNLSKLLKKDTTIFLAIALMLPPLFFAYIYGLLTRKNINEQLMRESFYAECYYFSPLSLAIWAFYYSLFFLTQGTFKLSFYNNSGLLVIPPILALVWFVSVETNALADDSKEDNITRPKAFFIVVSCITVMLAVGLLIYLSTINIGFRDIVRDNIIWLYLLISLGLLATYIVNWRKAHKSTEEEKDDKDKKVRKLTFRKLIVPLSVFTILLCCIAPVAWLFAPVPEQSPAPSASEGTASVVTPIVGTPGNGSLSPVPLYYKEDFKQDIGNWEQHVLNGDSDLNRAILSYEDGGIHFHLSPKPDQFLSTYLINTANEYTDVQVEATTKNKNQNSNTVSLICRYNDKGWYEFEISNSGNYNIYRVDATQVDETNQSFDYTPLTSGNSSTVKTDLSENTYRAICKDNILSLFINDTPIETVQEPASAFKKGKIGIAAYSPENMEVDVDFESVTISKPPPQLDLSDVGTPALPVAEAIPTVTPTPENPLYFTEEFDGNLDRWQTIGDASQLKLPPENGSLHFQLAQKDGQTPSVYLINNTAPYDDVQVEAVATNNGNNSNGVDLVCRLNENGWYEFEVSNTGLYNIYVIDTPNNSYATLASGNSSAIKTGLAQNTYTAICKGNELTLIINGTPVETVQETKFNFSEGRIGIGVSSLQGFPVDVSVESVKVSEP